MSEGPIKKNYKQAELEDLHSALDGVQEGIILLDADMNAQFMNRAVRRLWKVSDEQADSRPAFAELVGDSRHTRMYAVGPEHLDDFIARRVALVRSGDSTPQDIQTSDGRHIRASCSILPSGGRMLTYCDVTDLITHSKQLEKLATTDALTGISNRRHFLAMADTEWERFQRYHRPLSFLMVDLDNFKTINDRFGHATGDRALRRVVAACHNHHRSSDVVGRIGGDEFGILLPETTAVQACVVAHRICGTVEAEGLKIPSSPLATTVSIGVAEASLGMSSLGVLMNAADKALYDAKAAGRNCVMRFEPPQSEVKLAAE